MNYSKLLEKYNDMSLYSFIILPECMEEAVVDIGQIMKINVERETAMEIIENEDIKGANKIACFIAAKDKRRFIFIDCNQKSDLYEVYIKCLKKESDEVNRIIDKWFDITAKEYGLPTGDKPIDWLHDEKYKLNPLLDSLKFNGII